MNLFQRTVATATVATMGFVSLPALADSYNPVGATKPAGSICVDVKTSNPRTLRSLANTAVAAFTGEIKTEDRIRQGRYNRQKSTTRRALGQYFSKIQAMPWAACEDRGRGFPEGRGTIAMDGRSNDMSNRRGTWQAGIYSRQVSP